MSETDVTYVNASGDPIDPHDPARQVKPVAKKRDNSEGYHKGFRVLGYPPGVIEVARKEYEANRLRISRANIGAIKVQREPGPWSETAWKQGHRPKRVNGRAYEVQEAAVQCMRMAEAAGWSDVILVEIKKEPAKKPQE